MKLLSLVILTGFISCYYSKFTYNLPQSLNVTLSATLNLTASSIYTRAASFLSAEQSSVTCTVEGVAPHEFHRVTVAVSDVEGRDDKGLNQECRISMDRAVSQDSELFLITGGQYYTSSNITGATISVDIEGAATYRLSLQLPKATIPEEVRNTTAKWACGIRDPLTGDFYTSPFTVTRIKTCEPGHGFFLEQQTACSICPNGTYSEADNTCTACPADRPKSSAGSYEISQCKKEGGPYTIYYVIGGTVGAVVLIAALIGSLVFIRRRMATGDQASTVTMSHIYRNDRTEKKI